jgi:hypothetical protein
MARRRARGKGNVVGAAAVLAAFVAVASAQADEVPFVMCKILGTRHDFSMRMSKAACETISLGTPVRIDWETHDGKVSIKKLTEGLVKACARNTEVMWEERQCVGDIGLAITDTRRATTSMFVP